MVLEDEDETPNLKVKADQNQTEGRDDAETGEP